MDVSVSTLRWHRPRINFVVTTFFRRQKENKQARMMLEQKRILNKVTAGGLNGDQFHKNQPLKRRTG